MVGYFEIDCSIKEWNKIQHVNLQKYVAVETCVGLR